ncbi:hypothetical protein QBC34DRAFT_440512 [Podospora aff. communis PSN243]|uniref:C2H2-type domain-containing protein n=1 Tax=Podospora aff. communis PSN243 TaxID=3040156 RepID=A0AAV9GE89_9PEZI|nr:hypothetical protein QBC34DRAFT_440512 [Podospora aff. communis PSN243]
MPVVWGDQQLASSHGTSPSFEALELRKKADGLETQVRGLLWENDILATENRQLNRNNQSAYQTAVDPQQIRRLESQVAELKKQIRSLTWDNQHLAQSLRATRDTGSATDPKLDEPDLTGPNLPGRIRGLVRKNRELIRKNRDLTVMNECLATEFNNRGDLLDRFRREIKELRSKTRLPDFFSPAPASSGSEDGSASLATRAVGSPRGGYYISLGPKHPASPARKPGFSKRRRVAHRRRVKKVSLGAINVLSTWLDFHGKEADPTEDDLRKLSHETGLRPTRVARCLEHMRASYPSPIELFLFSSSSDDAPSEAESENALPCLQHPVLFDSAPDPNQDLALNVETPEIPLLSQDLHVGHNHDVVSDDPLLGSLDSVTNAGETGDFCPLLDMTWPEFDIAGWIDDQAPGINSLVDHPFPFPVPTLTHTELPIAPKTAIPAPSQEPRTAGRQKKKGGPLTFQCTFCHVRLTERAWKRHEEDQHLPRRKWTCLLTGSIVGGRCAFRDLNPHSRDHHDHERVADCAARDPEARSFIRKDGLVQHVISFHGAAQLRADVAEAWKVAAERREQDWACGFCGETLHGWDARATHLAAHFRQGMTMDSWEA